MSALSMHTPAGAVAPVLRGVSQIFFIADWRTGLLITAGVAVYNPLAAIFMLLGAAAQEVGAWAMGQDRQTRSEGIAGFNGAPRRCCLVACGTDYRVGGVARGMRRLRHRRCLRAC